MTLLLTILGILVLLPSVAGIAFGVFMALGSKTRGEGVIFALWWVSGVVAALGILVRDPATFAMGLFCFTVAGLALISQERHSRKPVFDHETRHAVEEDTRAEGPSREVEPEQLDEEPSENTTERSQASSPNDHPETSIIADDDDMESHKPEEDEPQEKQ